MKDQITTQAITGVPSPFRLHYTVLQMNVIGRAAQQGRHACMPATTRRPAGGQLGELCIYDDGDSLISAQALVGSYHTEVSGVSFGPSTGTSGNVSQCLTPKSTFRPQLFMQCSQRPCEAEI